MTEYESFIAHKGQASTDEGIAPLWMPDALFDFQQYLVEWSLRKEPDDERHVHPLQLDVIERAVILWSNEGDTVLTPFLGVGSEAYGAVVNKRRALGVELKPAYYRQAVKNLEAAVNIDRKRQPPPKQRSMFEAMDGEDAP